MEVFHIKNLSFTYPIHQHKSLQNINLKINKGEFITLCGQSGCGKTTLIRQLKPTLTPHGEIEGEVLFDQRLLKELDLREQTERIGYVLQNPDNQIVTDKVWHELAFGLESLGYDTYKIRLKVAEMASFFGIQGWFYKNVSELSGGQKQLLNLASVMAMSPDVLILDEPTSQLDPISAVDFLETLKKINRDLGTTIILTEHRLEEVFPMTDRVIVMEKGAIILDDTPEVVCKKLLEADHPMQYALPSPARILGKVGEERCVLTIKEGRKILEEKIGVKQPFMREVAREKTYSPAPTVLDLKGVYFRYEKNSLDVLSNLDLSIGRGEWYALVGGNGVGKSTTLAVINQIRKPYRGKIKNHQKKVVTLPQNPQALFVKNKVYDDLADMLKGMGEEAREEQIRAIANVVEIEQYLDRHPYDLSGGEQQRVALAKILLLSPEILLLDEPTKGLDAHFKIKLAGILKTLQASGVTILMVSHDIEFCAQYADRCGLFFNGGIVTENDARAFFAGNSFYTTSSNRMARDVFENAVTVEEVVALWNKNKSV
ncbi:MAG: ABC transporter ATP-binding protein [Cellulosilyticaceae bacterium]